MISEECRGGKKEASPPYGPPACPQVHHDYNSTSVSLARGGGEVTLANLFRMGAKCEGAN